MMKRFPNFLLPLVALALVWSPLTASAAESNIVHSGAFLQQVARAAGLPAGDAATAHSSLLASGIDLTSVAADKPLTEAVLVMIGSAVGIELTTETPGAPVSSSAAAQFLQLFGDDIAASIGGTDNATPESHPGHPQSRGADPLTKGKGKKKGLLKSPSHPG